MFTSAVVTLNYFSIQMPLDLAKAVRMLHTPSKIGFGKLMLRSSTNAERSNNMNTLNVMQEPNVLVDASLARRRSAAARAILDSADCSKIFKPFHRIVLRCSIGLFDEISVRLKQLPG